MKRLGIYLTFDRQKKIDRYVGYFLRELRTCVSTLAVVCNMEEIIQGEENIRPYADRVFFRENIGFDAGGFKDALSSLIGWETVLQYDELVLANDSMFGPFCPMADIFEAMEKESADFWGLLKHAERTENYIPEHVQSFFLVVRPKLLHSQCFQRYWEEMPYFGSHEQTISEYELKFTSHFSKLGFTYKTLADSDVNDSQNLNNNFCQFTYIPYELIKRRNFPFLKRRVLGIFDPRWSTQVGFQRALDYIAQETDYPIELIWEDIVRIHNISDIYKTLQLRYIITPVPNVKLACAAIVVFISYGSSYEFVCEYLGRLAGPCRIVVCAESRNLLRPYEDSGYECRELHSTEVPRFLSGFDTYDYVCVLHDTDMSSLVTPSYIGKSEFYNIWGNLARGMDYVSGVIDLFEKQPYLGFLTMPQNSGGEYLEQFGLGWNGTYDEVCGAVKRMGLICNLSTTTPPYRITNDFWIRGSILKKLECMDQKDVPLLPYLWSYLAQDAGFFSGVAECADYAALCGINLQYYMDQICAQARTQYNEFHNFRRLQCLLSAGALQEFCKKYSQIYVYGTGDISEYCQDILPEIKGYIVSDGHPKRDIFHGLAVKYLSEVELSKDCGVVLCLVKRNQEQVIKLLEAQNFKHYFCV